jgi:hypothetical protein
MWSKHQIKIPVFSDKQPHLTLPVFLINNAGSLFNFIHSSEQFPCDKEKQISILHTWDRDNTLAHDTLTVQEFLAKKSITNLDHSPHSPDWLCVNYGYFQSWKPLWRTTDLECCWREVALILTKVSDNTPLHMPIMLVLLMRKESTNSQPMHQVIRTCRIRENSSHS